MDHCTTLTIMHRIDVSELPFTPQNHGFVPIFDGVTLSPSDCIGNPSNFFLPSLAEAVSQRGLVLFGNRLVRVIFSSLSSSRRGFCSPPARINTGYVVSF